MTKSFMENNKALDVALEKVFKLTELKKTIYDFE